MSEQIEPVLSADEWAALSAREWVRLVGDGVEPWIRPSELEDLLNLDTDDLRKAIAIANALLPDDDPRKITREWVQDEGLAAFNAELLAAKGDAADRPYLLALAKRHRARADALESYLPPEKPA